MGKINKQRDIHGDRQTDKGKIQSKTGELYGQRRRMTETNGKRKSDRQKGELYSQIQIQRDGQRMI